MADLTFRDISPEDFDRVHETASDWSVVRQLGSWPWPPDPAFTMSRCQPYQGSDGFVWSVCLGDHMIGSVSIVRGVIGYTFHPGHHGQGFGTYAARRAIEHAFATYPALKHIRAQTWADNDISHKLLIKLGFEHWQTHYEWAKARKTQFLTRNYRLYRATWDNLKPTAQ